MRKKIIEVCRGGGPGDGEHELAFDKPAGKVIARNIVSLDSIVGNAEQPALALYELEKVETDDHEERRIYRFIRLAQQGEAYDAILRGSS